MSYDKLHRSDGIYSFPMDPMDSIGTTFDPFLRIDAFFLSVLRTETPHVRWNLFVFDGSHGLHRNDFRPPLTDGTPTISVLFTDGLPVFRWKADDVRWSLVDSIGQPSTVYALSMEDLYEIGDTRSQGRVYSVRCCNTKASYSGTLNELSLPPSALNDALDIHIAQHIWHKAARILSLKDANFSSTIQGSADKGILGAIRIR